MSTRPTAAYLVGVAVNASWVVGLWALLRALAIAEPRIRRTVVLLAFTGVIWVNTVYPWPKLLAGALCLGAAAAVLQRRAVLAGALAALALLSHGGALFAVLGLIPWFISRFGKRCLMVGVVAFAIYAPWLAYVKLIEPPGDRLIKWHFAGTWITESDTRSPLESIASAYRDAGPTQVVENKLNNARVVLGDPSVFGWFDLPGTPAWTGFWGELRAGQLTRIAWGPGVLLIGLWWWRRVPKTLWALLGAWALTLVLLEWGGIWESAPWTIHGPYALVVGFAAACALASPRWLYPPVVASFVFLWYLSPPVLG